METMLPDHRRPSAPPRKRDRLLARVFHGWARGTRAKIGHFPARSKIARKRLVYFFLLASCAVVIALVGGLALEEVDRVDSLPPDGRWEEVSVGSEGAYLLELRPGDAHRLIHLLVEVDPSSPLLGRDLRAKVLHLAEDGWEAVGSFAVPIHGHVPSIGALRFTVPPGLRTEGSVRLALSLPPEAPTSLSVRTFRPVEGNDFREPQWLPLRTYLAFGESDPSLAWVILPLAFALAVAVARVPGATVLGVALVTVAVGYAGTAWWSDLVSRVWFHYAPDGYLNYAARFAALPSDAFDRDNLLWFARHFRNGQVPVVPALLAGLRVGTGLGWTVVYWILNLLFVFGTALVLFRTAGPNRPWAGVVGATLVFLHPFVITGAMEFQTDMAGAFFSLAFVAAYGAYGRRPGWFRGFLAGACLLAAALTRIALYPLLLVPPCWAAYVLLFRRAGPGTAVRLALPGIGAGLVVVSFLAAFGLWETFAAAREFAADPQWRNLFTVEEWAKLTLLASGPLAVVAVVLARRVPDSPDTLIAAGSFLGVVLLLAFGEIVPWERYWLPAAVIAGYGALALLRNARGQSSDVRRVGIALALWAVGLLSWYAFGSADLLPA